MANKTAPNPQGRQTTDNIVPTTKTALVIGVRLKQRLEKYSGEHGLDQSGVMRMAIDLFLTERGY